MARDIRKGVAGRKPQIRRPFRLPGLPYRPPKPVPPRRAFPGAAGGLRVLQPKKPVVQVVHTARPTPRPKPVLRQAGPIKAPVRATTGTRSTLPPHASTGAVRSHSLTDRTPAAKARLTPPPRRTVTAPATVDTSPFADLTDQDLVNQQLQPLYLENDQQMQELQRLQAQRAAVIQQMTQGIMGQLSTIAPQVQQEYQGFFDRNLSAAKEGAAALAAASPDKQIQADLAAVGAPTEQHQQIATQDQNVFQGGGAVLQDVAGTIPGQAIASSGAAETAYARKLPAFAALQGQQTLKSFLQDMSDQQLKVLDDRRLIAAKAPGLLQDIMTSRLSQDAKNRALDLEEAALRRQLGNDVFNRGVTRTKLTQAQTRLNQTSQQQNTSNQMRYAEIYGYDPKTGKPTLAAIKAAKADKAKGKKPPSATALSNWNKFAEDAYHGVAPKTRYDTGTGQFVPIPGTGKQPVEYYAALKRLMAMGATLARAQQVLNSLYSKGEGGRPYVSLQGRLALENAGMPLPHTNAAPSAAQIAYLRQHGLWSD